MDQHHTATGYSLRADVTSFGPGQTIAWTFDIVGPNGRPRSYRIQHERELHLIIVRDDLSTFSHLHPTRRDDGMWTVDLSFASPGSYTAFADVAPDDAPAMTLRIPLKVEGEWEPQPLPRVSNQSEADGYSVTMQGQVRANGASELQFHIAKEGVPVTPEPYLGAGGHLVALRAGDLEYLHVHPLEESPHGAIAFMMHAGGAGTYRLFLQFLHDGAIRTVDFTVEAVVAATSHHSEPHAHG
ncbi:MAG: hypothetical protein M3N24_10390 [Actinomycetota bacterium]|nr:hypothetical protein [Actinomycetota bacterium]